MSPDQASQEPVKVVLHCCGCPHAEAKPEPALPGLVAVNLALLIGLGVAASGWMLYYTDWFPVFGGLLGLGGLFAWIAFVSGLLTDERKKQLQKAFESRFLLKHRVWMVVLALAAAFLLFASLHGSIVLHSLADDQGRIVKIARAGADGEADEIFVPARAVQKRLVFTGWGGRGYRVSAAGLPAASLEAVALRRRVLSSPSSFTTRPVLLIRPDPRVSNNAERNDFKLVVWRGGEVLGTIAAGDYRGEAVWVGCDADVQVPDEVTARWRLEMLRDKIPAEVMARWTAPLALATEVSLAARDPMRAALLQADGSIYAEGSEWIAPPLPGRGFVHELQLKILPPAQPLSGTEVPADAEPPSS